MAEAESWAIVDLMGHVELAGRITKPGEYGGLWQIDIPEGDTFRTEFFGSQSVYRIRMVSEQIARAYAPHHEVIEYGAPIITREEHEQKMQMAREQFHRLQNEVEELRLHMYGSYWPIDWIIVGGESGASCRPFDPEWARHIHWQCRNAGIPFFMKQLGGFPDKHHDPAEWPEDLRVQEFPEVRDAAL